MMSTETRRSDRIFYVSNAVVSVAALAFLAWLLLASRGEHNTPIDISFFPAINAALNAMSASLLLAGWWAIRQNNRQLHQKFMTAAFVASALFLVGYVVYHYLHGDTKYAGEGSIRYVYFTILISHIVLSAAVVPLCLSAFYFALRGRFEIHKRVTKVLAPIWLYVSVTGVAIYFFLNY